MNDSNDRAELLKQINVEIDKLTASSLSNEEKVAILPIPRSKV